MATLPHTVYSPLGYHIPKNVAAMDIYDGLSTCISRKGEFRGLSSCRGAKGKRRSSLRGSRLRTGVDGEGERILGRKLSGDLGPE